MSGEITCKPSRGHSYSATVDEPKLVPQTTQTAGGGIHCYSAQEGSVRFAGDSTTTPITGETDFLGMSFVRKLFEDRGFSKKTTDIIMHSWRDSSRKQYDVHIRKWILFCSAREIDLSLSYFNSTLNPFLYWWKISEVRQAMKQTIRQALCCPWS